MNKNIFRKRRGQTAVELAAFGAIIIFLIGAIVRTVLSSGYQQNQNLKAMRAALSKSHLYSEGAVSTYGNPKAGDGEASRNTGVVIIVEDRLTADATKVGAIDRIPFLFSSSGVHSRNLLLPLDSADEYYHLPVVDFYVNGKHFPLRTAAFKNMCLERNKALCAPGDDWINTSSVPYTDPVTLRVYPPRPGYWDNNCAGTVPSGCPRFFTRIVNAPRETRWCNDLPGLVTGARACPAGNINAQRRFDLTLKWTEDNSAGQGDIDVPIGPVVIDPGRISPPPIIPPRSGYPRIDFSWQWYSIEGWNVALRGLINPGAEGVFIKDQTKKNTGVDIDGDLEEEQILRILKHNAGVITRVSAVDNQEGDLDINMLGKTGPDQIGLLPDTEITTEVRPGTYLRIEEGKLYDANNQFVRSVQKRDHIDTITRRLRLSKNTGRFCRNTPGPAPATIDENGDGIANTTGPQVEEPNPVEVCADTDGRCINDFPSQTCMSLQTNTIFIRSRPVDKRGRKWIQNISGDNYVNFTVPKKP